MYRIASFGNASLPVEVTHATQDNVEDVLRQAAAFLGHDGAVNVEHVPSVVGACVPCVDVVAYVNGMPVLVARPALW